MNFQQNYTYFNHSSFMLRERLLKIELVQSVAERSHFRKPRSYEIVKQELNDGERPDLYFYRDSHGNEVDLPVKRGRSIIPVEIKSAATFKTAFVKGIQSFSEAAEGGCLPGYVLYNGDKDLSFRDTQVINPFRKDTSQAKFLDMKFR